MTRGLVLVALAFISFAAAANAERVVGQATVIDGDTIEIHSLRVRLAGIDSPEAGQICYSAAWRPWRCGQDAAFALADKIGRATVTCTISGRDRYARAIGQCHAAGRDLGEWMIETGLAVRYYDRKALYRDAEQRARATRRGIWAGAFEKPVDWRRRH